MDQPTITKATAAAVHNMLDTTQEVIRGLKALGDKAEQRDLWLIHILATKLDSESRTIWAQASTGNDYPTLNDFITFLEQRAESLETVQACYTNRKPQTNHIPKQSSKPESKSFATTTNNVCELCKLGDHKLFQCSKFKEMSIANRRSFIASDKRCYNCLNNNHSVYKCKVRARCFQCHRRHHTLLHIDEEHANSKQPTSKCDEPKPGSSSSSLVTNTSSGFHIAGQNSQVLLPTALICIQDNHGGQQKCRALLDSTSMESFITESCVQKLGLHRRKANMIMKGLGESDVGQSRGEVTLHLMPQDEHKQLFMVNALIISKITSMLPITSVQLPNIGNLHGVKLADPGFNKSGPIELLLGTEVFYAISEQGKIMLENNLVLSQTAFGWTVTGRTVDHYEAPVQSFITVCDVDASLRRFWEIEMVPEANQYTEEEQQCEKHFVETINQCHDGKFIAKLPFKRSRSELDKNFYVAFNRLRSMERKMAKDDIFKRRYIEFMQEYVSLGHMKEVICSKIDESLYFLPHHGVLKEASTTTKLRVVFDASSSLKGGSSLNNVLMVGPTIQSSLFHILIRFRQHKFVIAGDIEKMYRMIWIDEKDTEVLNILWRENINSPIKHYRLKTITYGTGPASFMSTRCLKELANRNADRHPIASKVISEDIYVDDLMTGAKSREELIAIKSEIVSILGGAGFNLRKWCTNDSQICDELGILYQQNIKLDENLEAPRLLGLEWQASTDEFSFKVKLDNIVKHSKRTVLSEASKIFDPLGWLAPSIVRVKIMFQRFWLLNLNWDDELPTEVLQDWIKLREDLTKLSQIRIPRWLNSTDSVELHGFCDASKWAYAAVVFCRVQHNETVFVNLISAKTKVAPMKQISIPRLELMGALLLSKLVQSIQSSLRVEVKEVTLWTDSKIVLDWLASHPRRWPTFVGNRTAAIIELYKRECWRHVPTKDNPADCASRGLAAVDLKNENLWWSGPNWLKESEQSWPMQLKSYSTNEEGRESSMIFHVMASNDVVDHIINRISGFYRMTKIFALVLRIKSIWLSKIDLAEKISENMSTAEMDTSAHILIRCVQQNCFPEEIKCLSKNVPIKNQSVLKSLSPFIDPDGIMRVGGRIRKSVAAFSTKHPIILPRSSIISMSIVSDYHKRYFHAGISLLMSLLRQKYWIIRMKDLVRQVVRKCVQCIRQRPVLQEQFMGDLPASRVVFQYAFCDVGIDYAGPFKIQYVRRRGQVPAKAYVCVFVCLATKAVHLECVMDLSTASFLGALHRFTNRRGACKNIYSDNGTNFVGANRHLSELYQFLKLNNNFISSSLLRDNFVWHFNPPGAPHMGGIWEAAVKSMKAHFRKVVGDHILTLEEFNTLLTHIEAMLNSRPICAVSSDLEDEVLTPAHFLIQRPLTIVPEVNPDESQLPYPARWEFVKKLSFHFWRRWQHEYLTTLQARSKWKDKKPNMQINDVVLIKEDNQSPSQWSMGKIIEVHAGADELVRVVTIKTSRGTMQRPVAKLVKLPVYIESDDSRPSICSDASSEKEN